MPYFTITFHHQTCKTKLPIKRTWLFLSVFYNAFIRQLLLQMFQIIRTRQHAITTLTRSHRIGGSLKLLRESTNADGKRLKIAFSIANCSFRLPICNPKRCFNAYRSALLDSRDSSQLPPIRCEGAQPVLVTLKYLSPDMTKSKIWVCAQRRLGSAWASAQSDQSLRCALNR